VKKEDLQPLKGFRDELPAERIPKQAMLGTIARVFESYGFAPLDSPALERASVLVGKYGEEGDRLLYRFRDHGDRDVALRYDLTVPLARVIGSHPELTMPFKRYQIGKVWRAERPARGRFREFMQCDVDILGAGSLLADCECLQVICSVLEALGVGAFRVEVNNRKLLNALLAHFAISGRDRVHASLRILDKLGKIPAEDVRDLLVSEVRWTPENAAGFMDCVTGGLGEAKARLPADDPGLAELEQLLELAELAGIRERVHVNLSIARGLDYYTGTIYETFLTELPGFGSVMSGGRYDDLLKHIAGRDLPAIGVSLGISRLFAGLHELGLVAPAASPARVMVASYGAETARETLACAKALRDAGLPTDSFPGDAKLGKQFKHAHRLGVDVVCIIGPEEAEQGLVRVKVLSSGDQRDVPAAGIADEVNRALEKSGATGIESG